jgi:hypothetical protein
MWNTFTCDGEGCKECAQNAAIKAFFAKMFKWVYKGFDSIK